jgi:two-component system cell cycle response regulator DivK
MLLADLACDVRVVRNAEEARALLCVFRPRVVLVDLVLPRMSGLLLVRTLKADPATSNIVVIAVTFINEPGTERLAREVGCAALVLKPINAQTVVGTLVQHVSAAAPIP